MKKQKFSTQSLENIPKLLGSNELIEDRLAVCPQSPGVYLMKNEAAHVIYVGKAKNLRSRVRSYFQNSANHSAKTVHLVSHVAQIDFMVCQSESEALILENTLIKKYKPKYNILLKDDKTYPYLRIDKSHEYPRVYIARKPIKSPDQTFYGPYVNGAEAYMLISAASKVFKLRDCRDHDFSNRSRPCLSYEIGQCTAPCVDLVSSKEYLKQLMDFESFVKNGSDDVREIWAKEMERFSESLEYERAAAMRDKIALLDGLKGATPSVVSQTDLENKDVWNIWPKKWDVENVDEANEQELVLCGVFYFRSGKWVGQTVYSLELAQVLAPESFWPQVLLSHYSKHELPQRILIPTKENLSDDVSLGVLIGETAQRNQKTEELLVPQVSTPDERQEWDRIFSLTTENIKSRYEEQLLTKQRKTEELLELQKFLDLKVEPKHMECIDVSNFQGEANVASAVVFKEGRPSKSDYRHYIIKGVQGQNDFESMKEVIYRRYGKPGSPKPDLLIVDGGKGQLNSVVVVLKDLGCEFPVVGLAKARTVRNFRSSEIKSSEERVFFPGQKNEVKIKSPAVFKLLTHIRDEAHRFAIEFNRVKMAKREET